jgi:uncharacterized YceG family protein
MPPFGRRQQSGSRTPQERERARLEREARRAAREGRPAPQPPPADDPAWVDEEVVGVDEEPARLDEPSVVHPAPAPDEEPAPVPTEEPAPVPTEDPAPAPVEDEHHAWDDTGAWATEPAPEESAAPVAAAQTPPLGEELAAVDRGWFEDDEPHPAVDAEPDEPGQPTVEWDVLSGRPKTRPEPPSGPAGGDAATVEWDVMSEAPRPAVPERLQRREDAPAAAPTPAEAPTAATADVTAKPGRPVPAPRTAPAPAPPSPRRAGGATRFDDEDERPVPTRRVKRERTLPPPPPGPGEKRRRGFGKGAFAAVIAVFLLAVALYLVNALYQPLADDGSGEVRVVIPQNSSASDVGEVLEREGVVDSAFFFEARSRLAGAELKAGAFTLQEGMRYGDAIKALEQQPEAPKVVNVTIPEGRARRETAPLIQQAGLRGSYLRASERSPGFSTRRYGAPRNVKSLEGFLFPATYEMAPTATSRQLVSKQVQAFEDNIEGVSMRRARARNLSTFDVLTIASMIDREATLDKERRLISAVIHNRLQDGMPLGIDATIRFATRNWSSPLKESELNIDSPYNTRRRTGLPPGPIGSPGLASIKAAANPANVDYLYYVVKPCGKGAHNFSSSDTEFEKDRLAYEAKREELGGKSPVDC